jgi:hypothetical protein
MIKLWIMFAVFAVLIHLGITAWRNISGKERWTLTKTAGYSIIVALLAVLAMSVVVILF